MGAQYKDIANAFPSVYGIKGDCGSTEGIKIKVTDRFLLFNRYVIDNGENILITTKNVDKYLNKEITLRDPSKCKQGDDNYCSHCMGETIFNLTKLDRVPLGMYLTKAGSDVMNMYMKATHSLHAKMFEIKDMNKYLYSRENKNPDLFEHIIGPDKIERIYVKETIDILVPESSVSAVDTYYKLLVHGSVITNDKGEQFAFILGTNINTNPDEIFKPDTTHNSNKNHYILRYNKGSVFINSIYTLKEEDTTFKMLNMFMKGTATNLVPIEAHFMALKNAFYANKAISTPDVILTIILYSLARDKNNIDKPIRETGNEEYKFISTSDTTTLTNTMNALFGGDGDRALHNSASKSQKEQEKRPSPLEQVLRY